MRLLYSILAGLVMGFLLFGISSKMKVDKPENISGRALTSKKISFSGPRFNSRLIDSFFKYYPKYIELKPDVAELYQKYDYNFLWYSEKGVNDLAFVIYDKIGKLDEEGINRKMPYKAELDTLFIKLKKDKDIKVKTELLLSSMYFFYENKVFRGLDSKKTEAYGWFLPRKNISYVDRLDSFLKDSTLFYRQRVDVFDQYFKLKEALTKYREIEKNGGWKKIPIPDSMPILNPGYEGKIISKIKKRLFITGDLATLSTTNIYDAKLAEAIKNYKKRHAFTPNSHITQSVLKSMNISVESRIKTIEINMERCRWMSPELIKADAYIVINIPSFNLIFFRDDKPELVSRVVVGKMMNQTVVFSGEMNKIVFSPYWNIPTSIVRKEIFPAIERNSEYLAQNEMEWVNGRLRQRPGPKNPLGKVKFIFPNSNDIYLHDTPSKSLFKKDQRAFSHGCIRVEDPRDLAIAVLKGDSLWTRTKIEAAMNSGRERGYQLKNKIPVYIGYFTGWVDQEGNVNFYNDIYRRDSVLSKLLEQ